MPVVLLVLSLVLIIELQQVRIVRIAALPAIIWQPLVDVVSELHCVFQRAQVLGRLVILLAGEVTIVTLVLNILIVSSSSLRLSVRSRPLTAHLHGANAGSLLKWLKCTFIWLQICGGWRWWARFYTRGLWIKVLLNFGLQLEALDGAPFVEFNHGAHSILLNLEELWANLAKFYNLVFEVV